MNAHEPYNDLARYPMDTGARDDLLAEQLECSVVWTTNEGWPVGVVHWFVWQDERFWVTCTPQRRRVAALRTRPQSCVIVSSLGTSMGANRSITAKTRATVHDDADTKEWFFPMLARKAFPTHERRAAGFEQMLRETNRVAIELAPVEFITYDGHKMTAAVAAARS